MRLSRRTFLASLAGVVAAPVVAAFAPAHAPIVLGPPFEVPFVFLTESITVDEFAARYITPAAAALADKIDQDYYDLIARSM